jgi:nucleoside-diphosphate kinase
VKKDVEQVLILIKPDGMQKGLVGSIIDHFVDGGLALKGLKLVRVPKKLAENHYGHLKTKFFFKQIVDYLTGALHGGSAVVAMVFEGSNAIKRCRDIAGATNPEEADPLSIRGRYGRITTKGVYENLVHVSSDAEEAKRELALWFKKGELI